METPCIEVGRRARSTRTPSTHRGRLLDYADRRLMDLATRHREDREALPTSEQTDETDERD